MAGLGGTVRGRRRLIVTLCLLGLMAAGLVVRLVYLMVILPAREPGEPLVLPQVERGAILDRRGRILAITTRHQDVSAWAPGITDPRGTAELLGTVLGMDPAALQDSWRRRPGYSVIKRRLSGEEAAAIAALRSQGKLAGIRLEDGYGRMYPEGRLASTLIGTVGVDNTGLEGIEYTFNDELAPQTVGTNRDTVYGSQVVLTIDAAVQHRVERVAREAFRSTRADSLMVLVLDADTAEVLAWVSLPDFDPNEVQTGSSTAGHAELTNRPVAMAYEPGSVFKVFSIASLLQLGTIDSASTFTCRGYYEQPLADGTSIRIGCIREHGVVDARRILQYSCNAGAAYASDTATNEAFAAALARFGFGRKTGVPLPGESAGLLAPVAKWSVRSKATIAFGQEVSASALQVAAAAVAIADGGTLLEPLVVSRIVAPDGRVVKAFGRKPLWEAVSAQTARQMLDMLESATGEGGTARRAAIEGLRISAKTGTAQVTDPVTGKYSESDFIASMLGIFPTGDPEVVVYVVIQNPRGESYFGSTIAAPVFRDVALELVDALGIARDGDLREPNAGSVDVPAPASATIGDVMPDLAGTPKRLLLPLLAREDLKVVLRGSGTCVRQEPPPGTPVTKGMRIVLELE
jgi:cell division protein FtsI (penicillin-binding protein 3)